MSRRAITPEQRADLSARGRELYEGGQGVVDVATILGQSTTTMRTLLIEAGTEMRSRRGARRVKIEPTELAELRSEWARRYEAGETIRQIAVSAGHTRYRVHTQLQAAGVAFRQGRGPASKRGGV